VRRTVIGLLTSGIPAVADSGTGIPNDKLKDVFETFFATKPQGTGLGLSIAHDHRDLRRHDLGREPGKRRRRIPLHPAVGQDASGMISEAPVIHIVDDDGSFRTAAARLLQASGYQIVQYESARQLLQKPPGIAPGCILLDVRMPGLSGPELQARLVAAGNLLPIVFLTGHGDIPTSVRAIKAGAEDFLSKPVAKKTLIDAIQRALARYEQVREQNLRLDALRALVASLTPREHQVFVLIVRGKLNKQIAHELGTSVRTIKAHRHAVMEKLKVQSLVEAVSIAERLGMLAASDHDGT
jgi:FixJ family two-component response regulator